ncbi:MAG: hypothetical protein K5866_04410 [Treponema sp.]|nr:hypothetical protein [Treponema sp.]
MKNKTSKIFILFSTIIYIGAIFYLVYNLTSEYKNGDISSKERFDYCVLNLKKGIDGKASGSREFNRKINQSFGNLNDFTFIEFFEDGKSIYKYQINEYSETNDSKLIKTYFQSFKINDSNYFLTANVYKLKPSSIFHYLLVSFLVILIVTIISCILIIYYNQKIKEEELIKEARLKANSINKEVLEEKSEETFVAQDSKEEVKVSSLEKETEIESEENVNSNQETEDTNSNQEAENLEEDVEYLPENKKVKEENINLTQDLEPVEIKDNPEGLFSPETGLGWEEYLLTRLNSELNRAISSEQDLSLFEFYISKLEKNSPTYKSICDYLVNAYQFRDLIFEYKENKIVAMRINMNIDEAIKFADDIYKDIKELLKDSFATCNIGITSRTIRLISGERLLKEADQALNHSLELNDSPIVGFRADSEKFRKFFEDKE